jgi:hypothetical protein
MRHHLIAGSPCSSGIVELQREVERQRSQVLQKRCINGTHRSPERIPASLSLPHGLPGAGATSECGLSSAFLEPVPLPCLADLVAFMFGPLTPPTRLAPWGEVRDKVFPQRLLRTLGVDP